MSKLNDNIVVLTGVISSHGGASTAPRRATLKRKAASPDALQPLSARGYRDRRHGCRTSRNR